MQYRVLGAPTGGRCQDSKKMGKLCEWNSAYYTRVWGWSTRERGDMAWTCSSIVEHEFV
jgi:hypothetical protein